MSDKKKVIIALGYFDCVHIAHRKVIEKTILESKKLNILPCVFSFDDGIYELKGGNIIYTKIERKFLLNKLGIEEIYFAKVTKKFLSLSPQEFLQWLNKLYDIKGYVFGEDYHFGNNKVGDANYIINFAKEHNQLYFSVPLVKENGEKISTTNIKELLKSGQIERANKLLKDDYFISGEVYHDRQVGRKIGFPTANIDIDEKKSVLKEGVYKGYTIIDNKKHLAIINYGKRPTFDLSKVVVEAHIIDFDGDLYGQNLQFYFTKYIREVKKFDSINQLKEQLLKDRESVIND